MLDPKDPLVYEITYTDGQVVRRKQHPISGKYMLLQVGAAKVECEYDENGDNLQRVFDSAGNEIRLMYYPDNTIKDLITNDGKEVSFQYNAKMKPVVIAMKGFGEIQVTYTDDGKIDKVNSTSGRAIALQVTTSFQKLLDLIRPFGQNDVTTVPELPFADAKLDILMADYQSKREADALSSTPASRDALNQAGLAVAR